MSDGALNPGDPRTDEELASGLTEQPGSSADGMYPDLEVDAEAEERQSGEGLEASDADAVGSDDAGYDPDGAAS